jgi:hypothetical protein
MLSSPGFAADSFEVEEAKSAQLCHDEGHDDEDDLQADDLK